MAEIIFRLPSKQVTYGYVEVRGTPEEFGIRDVGDAADVGAVYAVYVGSFLEGERLGLDGFIQSRDAKAPESDTVAEDLIKRELGATEISEECAVGDKVTVAGIEFTKHSAAPWEQPSVDVKPKPWEKKASSPAIEDLDW